MSKKKVQSEPVKKLPEAQPDAPSPDTALAIAGPSHLSTEGASEEIKEKMLALSDNLASVDTFRIPRVKLTSDGMEVREDEEPVSQIEGVIIHTKMTNVYYAKSYNPSEVGPPDCYSLDGKTPDISVKMPISQKCKGCPMAEFGTNNMKSGKACRNLKPLYILLSDESIMPRQLTVTPASLKSANQYLLDLTERGVPYRRVKTRIIAEKERGKTYVNLKFQMGERLTPQRVQDVEFLRSQWLPVMDAQMVEQREVDSQTPKTVQETSGEF